MHGCAESSGRRFCRPVDDDMRLSFKPLVPLGCQCCPAFGPQPFPVFVHRASCGFTVPHEVAASCATNRYAARIEG